MLRLAWRIILDDRPVSQRSRAFRLGRREPLKCFEIQTEHSVSLQRNELHAIEAREGAVVNVPEKRAENALGDDNASRWPLLPDSSGGVESSNDIPVSYAPVADFQRSLQHFLVSVSTQSDEGKRSIPVHSDRVDRGGAQNEIGVNDGEAGFDPIGMMNEGLRHAAVVADLESLERDEGRLIGLHVRVELFQRVS